MQIPDKTKAEVFRTESAAPQEETNRLPGDGSHGIHGDRIPITPAHTHMAAPLRENKSKLPLFCSIVHSRKNLFMLSF